MLFLAKSYLRLSFFALNCLSLVFLCSCDCEVEPKSNLDTSALDPSKDQIADVEFIKIANNLDRQITEAKAYITSMGDDPITGIVTFTKSQEGIMITAEIDGLSPGLHGFNIHEFGDCSGKNSDSIGAHYNPSHHKHGLPNSEESHVGDLGNLIADKNGHAHYEAMNTIIKLQGRNSILGRSVIIHADEDDFTTQPAGAAGEKIACGVIEPTSSS